MFFSHLLLTLGWIVYVALHSWLASPSLKQKAKQNLRGWYKHYRLAYTLFAFVTLVALLWYQVSLSSVWFYQPGVLVFALGGLVSVTGLALMLICIKNYFMSLSGLRSLLQETVYPELIISGIHRHLRHPLYLGTFLFIWGGFLLLPCLSLLIANVIITVYTLVAIRWEEEKLVGEFGEAYKQYQRKVPKLLPRFRLP